MSGIFSKQWWKAAGVRAVKTAAQAFIGFTGAGVVVMSDVNWSYILSGMAFSVVLSFATSLAGLPEVPEEVRDDQPDEGHDPNGDVQPS